MSFTSFNFIIFLTVLFVLYYVLPAKVQKILLLIGGYVFYASFGVKSLAFLLITTLSIFFISLKIGKMLAKEKIIIAENKGVWDKEERKLYKAKGKKKRVVWLVLALIINLGLLGFVKFPSAPIIVPIGISFYTLISLGYLIDVYRGTIEPENNLFKYALFASFFPLMIQGPIARYKDMSKDLFKEQTFDMTLVARGVTRILWGFFKKLVVADRLLPAVLAISGDIDTYYGTDVFIGMIFYTIVLYADFTGGIDITIGVAELFGVHPVENFDRPFSSKSLKEYWRRWHISMCNWFRDYVFYSVSVCAPMQKLTKISKKSLGANVGKRVPVYLSTCIVWFLTGLWHGANANFILWGMCNCFVLLVSEELDPLCERFRKNTRISEKHFYGYFQVVRTFLLVCAMNMFDYYSSVKDTVRAFCSMFKSVRIERIVDGTLLGLGVDIYDYVVLGFGVIVMLIVSQIKKKTDVRKWLFAKSFPVKFVTLFLLALCVLIFGTYGIGYDESQFIYNQF